MSYTPPAWDATNVSWQGEGAYTPPAWDATNVSWEPTEPGLSIAAVVPITADIHAAHGVAVSIGASVPITAAISCTVERYELRGETNLGGMLVERRVRAYLRSTGELVAEADTSVGKFRVPVGFTSQEFYITPIDLGADATDWLPPTANRVVSVLASDT